MSILVTGARGMIGRPLVEGLIAAGYDVVGLDRNAAENRPHYVHYAADLSDRAAIRRVFDEQRIERVIHLAALAHRKKETDLSWEHYRRVNVEGAKNVFDAAGDVPVLFISTVDVYGFFNGGTVGADTPLRPVTFYGKSKAMAEEECRRLKCYTIFRLSPVYTDEIKRDIQKRYYLKAPYIAYRIGRGKEYEILNVRRAVAEMVAWCASVPKNEVRVIKDDERMRTADYIRAERAAGRAKIVLYFPSWLVDAGCAALKLVTGENKYTYLLNKAAHPLRSE